MCGTVKTRLFFAALSFCLLFTIFLQERFELSNPAAVSAENALTAVPADVVKEQEELFETGAAEQLYENLPQYAGDPYVTLNDRVPLFTEEEIRSVTEVIYSDLDELGRCGSAVGLLGPETIPSVTREPIGDVRPSGWHTVRYDDQIEDRYLYNRCHLIGYQLAGANAEPRNLITGTRYLNIEGMLPFENAVLGYITVTGNHVLYRVTPVFEDENLIASGVLLEAYSVEDEGEGIQLCEYLFNVQPGVSIDYKTGDSREDSTYLVVTEEPEPESEPLVVLLPEEGTDTEVPDRSVPVINEEEITYVLNTNTKRFHYPSCPSVEEMKAKNRANTSDSREELIEQGYTPCGSCNP